VEIASTLTTRWVLPSGKLVSVKHLFALSALLFFVYAALFLVYPDACVPVLECPLADRAHPDDRLGILALLGAVALYTFASCWLALRATRYNRVGYADVAPGRSDKAWVWKQAASRLGFQHRESGPRLEGALRGYQVVGEVIVRSGAMGGRHYTRVSVPLADAIPRLFRLGDPDVIASVQTADADAFNLENERRLDWLLPALGHPDPPLLEPLWSRAIAANSWFAKILDRVRDPGSDKAGLAILQRTLYLEIRGVPSTRKRLVGLFIDACSVASTVERELPKWCRWLVSELETGTEADQRVALRTLLTDFRGTDEAEAARAWASDKADPNLRAHAALYTEDIETLEAVFGAVEAALLPPIIALFKGSGTKTTVARLRGVLGQGKLSGETREGAEQAIAAIQARLGPEMAGALALEAPSDAGRLSVAGEAAGALTMNPVPEASGEESDSA